MTRTPIPTTTMITATKVMTTDMTMITTTDIPIHTPIHTGSAVIIMGRWTRVTGATPSA